jgi:hypothetical protein
MYLKIKEINGFLRDPFRILHITIPNIMHKEKTETETNFDQESS